MNTSFAKRVQAFVAGGLTIVGFRALAWVPHCLLVEKDSVLFLAYLITGLGLPLGIGILLGSSRALHLTKIYLGLGVTMAIASLLIDVLPVPAPVVPQLTWSSVPDMLIPLTLFALLFWSGSPRFQDETDA